jgi:hypothetical protein
MGRRIDIFYFQSNIETNQEVKMDDKKVDFWKISLRKPNSEEIERISKYAVSYVFQEGDRRDPKTLLSAIKKEEDIKWLLRAVQSRNGLKENSIQHMIDFDGRTIGSVIVTREQDDSKSHSGVFELYLQKEMVGRGIEVVIFDLIKAQIRIKWDGKMKLLKAFCSSEDDRLYIQCGFAKLGEIPIATRSSSGSYFQESVLYKRLD